MFPFFFFFLFPVPPPPPGVPGAPLCPDVPPTPPFPPNGTSTAGVPALPSLSSSSPAALVIGCVVADGRDGRGRFAICDSKRRLRVSKRFRIMEENVLYRIHWLVSTALYGEKARTYRLIICQFQHKLARSRLEFDAISDAIWRFGIDSGCSLRRYQYKNIVAKLSRVSRAMTLTVSNSVQFLI